jgi:hypothetical protein
MVPITELGLATGFEGWSGAAEPRPGQANAAKARQAETNVNLGRRAQFGPVRATSLPGGPLGAPVPDYTPGPITDPVTDVPGWPGPTGPGIDRPTLPPDPPEFPGTPTPPEVPPIQTPGMPVTDVPGTGPEAS